MEAHSAAHAAGQPVLVTINGGSSSLKFAVYAAREGSCALAAGLLERLGSPAALLTTTTPSGRVSRYVEAATVEAAIVALLQWIREHATGAVVAIGHRIVFGGADLRQHQVITKHVRTCLESSRSMDPAHLPAQLALIDSLASEFEGVPQVACFDSAFHRAMPLVAQRLPLPCEYHDRGIQRLGFHGLSYEYLSAELARRDPSNAAGRVIYAHLGSGCSMAAVHNGRPVDTTMGFTPLGGLVMGTRPGDLDPGVITYLAREQHMTPEQLEAFLSRRCGLIGISGTSPDMRDLLQKSSTDTRAAEAVELFCYRARQAVGSLAASMGGLDAIVFSGGVGEHAAEIRARICGGLHFLGVAIDVDANEHHRQVISSTAGRVVVRVIPTNEEVVIARTVRRLLAINQTAGAI